MRKHQIMTPSGEAVPQGAVSGDRPRNAAKNSSQNWSNFEGSDRGRCWAHWCPRGSLVDPGRAGRTLRAVVGAPAVGRYLVKSGPSADIAFLQRMTHLKHQPHRLRRWGRPA